MLASGTLLYTQPPADVVLKHKSEAGSALRGVEIVRNFKGHGWCIGRILKQTGDCGVKDQKRLAKRGMGQRKRGKGEQKG